MYLRQLIVNIRVYHHVTHQQARHKNYYETSRMGMSRKSILFNLEKNYETYAKILDNLFQIVSQKLTWNAKSKIGSLENATHKPGEIFKYLDDRDILLIIAFSGGGDKRIMEIKTDFKERAKPKVGSKDNMTYQPGKITNYSL